MLEPRQQRWVLGGALILAGLAAFFGLSFSIFIAFALREIPDEGALLYWLRLIGLTILLWGGGGAFFGAILGAFASMIWRPRD